MRIYINELIRLWKTSGIIIAVVLACLVTFGVLKIQSRDMLPMASAADYKKVFTDLEGVDLRKAYELYKDKEYDRLDFSTEAFLNRIVKDEIEEQTAYEEYLDGVTDSARMITTVSVFSDKDSYSYKNAQKTAAVYERLKNKICIDVGPSKGVELWSGNGITGVIIIFVMLIMINEMILKDRESGQLCLYFSMEKGRMEHAAIKLLVCTTSAFAVTFFILLVALITSGAIFGIGNIYRSVQSIVGLKGCTIEVSVAGYIMIYYFMLSLTTSVICYIIFFIASIIRGSVKVYLVIAITFGIEAVFYYLISDNSYMAILKEFNLLSFLNPGRYLSVYGNVSMFGYPVSRTLFVVSALLILMLAFVPLAIKAYSIQTTINVKKKNTNIIFNKLCKIVDSIRKKFRPKSVSILGHEAYKLMICGGTIWIIFLFAAFEMYGFIPVKEYFENEAYFFYKTYLQKYEGPVTDETITCMEKERQEYQQIYKELNDILAECPPELAAGIVSQYQDRLKPKVGLDMLIDRVEELKENGGYIVYDTGYRLLTMDQITVQKELTLAIILNIMLVLSVTFIFSCDDRIYMDRITSVMLKGRMNLNIKKIIIGSIIAFLIYSINYLPYIFSVLDVYGSNGLNFPAQSVKNLEGTVFEIFGFSIAGCIKFYLILKYMVMIMEILIMDYLSKKLRSLSRSLVIGLVIFVWPLLMVYLMI